MEVTGGSYSAVSQTDSCKRTATTHTAALRSTSRLDAIYYPNNNEEMKNSLQKSVTDSNMSAVAKENRFANL